MERKIRILLAKPGLDGHDRGIKVIAAAFRDAGFEVIYTGLRQTPETIAEAAIQEDVDAIGMSILSGAHMTLFPRVLSLLKEKKAEQILLFGGGIIPEEDVQKLKGMGVGMLFTPGTTTTEAIEYVKNEVGKRRKEEKCIPSAGR
jgi:methylmalonyl-CoA mutase C-terminal domain/subunit